MLERFARKDCPCINSRDSARFLRADMHANVHAYGSKSSVIVHAHDSMSACKGGGGGKNDQQPI